MMKEFNDWLPVTINKKKIEVLSGTEAGQLFSVSDVMRIRRSEIDLCVDGVPVNPNHPITSACMITLEKPRRPLPLTGMTLVLYLPKSIEWDNCENEIEKTGANVIRVRRIEAIKYLVETEKNTEVLTAAENFSEVRHQGIRACVIDSDTKADSLLSLLTCDAEMLTKNPSGSSNYIENHSKNQQSEDLSGPQLSTIGYAHLKIEKSLGKEDIPFSTAFTCEKILSYDEAAELLQKCKEAEINTHKTFGAKDSK